MAPRRFPRCEVSAAEELPPLTAALGRVAMAVGAEVQHDALALAAASRSPHCAVLSWAGSGAMHLTGHPDAAPLAPAAAVVTRLEAAAALFGALTASFGARVHPDIATLLTGRAALLGLGRRGRRSANGTCRLLLARDGWVAVNLARTDDLASVPAIAQSDSAGSADELLGVAAPSMSASELAARAQLLGVPAAAVPSAPALGAAPVAARWLADPGPLPRRAPLVVDLSALWAGPLCAHLLRRAGAVVVKVESRERPDGARQGDSRFFDWLNGGHLSVAVDLSAASGLDTLRRLVRCADVVIEGSRPRALQQLGIDAEEVVRDVANTWVSISGYGRDEGAEFVAFGDDAAAAAGLVAWDDQRAPVFCGDAIADPVTGLYASVAAAACYATGGGRLVEISMKSTTAYAAAPVDLGDHPVEACGRGYAVRHGDRTHRVLPPRYPSVGSRRARALGADNDAIAALVGARGD